MHDASPTHSIPVGIQEVPSSSRDALLSVDRASAAGETSRGVEPVDASMDGRLAISVVDVRKVYKGKAALDGVSFNMYTGQVFALLGHNGAGKSTLHKIITGMLEPSQGTVIMYGNDVCTRGGREGTRTLMGVCPQHDILYDNLTVREHLRLFGAIKGIQGAALEHAVALSIDEVGMDDQSEVLSTNLSGGQKRKLSVAIALIGDPKVVCLDEPTSGMDPVSRRELWDLLVAKREDRVILFTTHQMDEADILAERKAIMSHGRLQCLGSSLFLKSRFGIGYSLNVSQRTAGAVIQDVVDMVSSCLPPRQSNGMQATLLSQEADRREVALPVPMADSLHFPRLFARLDQAIASGAAGIMDYGISMTTLEEVFLRLQSDVAPDADHQSITSPLKRSPSKNPPPPDRATLFEEDEERRQKPSRWRSIAGLALIRLRLIIRKPMSLFFQVFLPVVLITIALTLVVTPTKDSGQDEPLKLTLNGSTDNFSSYTIPYAVVGPSSPIVDAVINATGRVMDLRAVQGELQGSAGVLITNAPHLVALQLATDSPGKVRETVFFNTSHVHSLVTALAIMANAAPGGPTLTISTHPLPFQAKVSFDSSTFNTVLLLGIALSVIPGGFAVELVRDRQKKLKHLLLTAGVPISSCMCLTTAD